MGLSIFFSSLLGKQRESGNCKENLSEVAEM